MLKRLRTAHPILYCILAEVLFLGSLFLSSLVLTVALMAAGADFSGLDEYFLSLVQELVGAGAAWLLLRRTGRQGLLGRRGSGFWNGLLVGMYPLAFICYSIYSALIFERPDTPLLPAGRILSFLACMAMVGVAEEFLFRGVIAETLLEHFGTSRAGVWKACLLSGVLFGAAHLTNLSSSAPFGVLMQCAFSASLGALFAAIYFLAALQGTPQNEQTPHILGLHVVEQIAAAHGGRVVFGQNAPNGAKATVWLPCAEKRPLLLLVRMW